VKTVTARTVVRNRLPRLSALRRRVLHLRYWDRLPLSTVASRLNLTVAVAGALEREALAELRHHLTDQEEAAK
jgi:DNA-directed RNA polymerase specialized sigma24 family protein